MLAKPDESRPATFRTAPGKAAVTSPGLDIVFSNRDQQKQLMWRLSSMQMGLSNAAQRCAYV